MMEINETEKIVIAKPVACRPSFSSLKSLSGLITGEVNVSPSADFSESAVAVIKPRTTRLKTTCSTDLVGAEVLGSEDDHQFKKVDNVTSNVVYKPIAKLVSKTTVTLLANLGRHGINPTREIPNVQGRHGINPTREIPEVGTHIPPSNQEKHENTESERTTNIILENSEEENKLSSLQNNIDRPCYDGHSWRKYGQKQVKGSEYPRSYYRCTYPNCPVKKKVEKTLQGQIAEIVYKGEHNHPKPQTLNHALIEEHVQKPDASRNVDKSPFHGVAAPTNEVATAGTCNACVSTSNNSLGLSGECGEVSESLEADEFKSKRRKRENQISKSRAVGEASCEPQAVVQNNTDCEIIGDGFRWRKYGQKVVKGNPYPRSYYRCTSPKCNVRKFVERTSEDPTTFVTTYEGKHNHNMPIQAANSEASKTNNKNKS